jgi:nucleotide-binding universal stress UspA family protein
MKTIAVTIDLTESSRNSFTYAANLVRKTGGKLLIFHAYDSREIREGVELESIQSALKHFVDVNAEEFNIPSNRLETHIFEGELVAEIFQFCEEQNPDLLVMGTDGATGFKKLISGSNTVRVMDGVSVPMLIIPTGSHYKAAKKILLSVDLKPIEDDDALDILKEYAMIYQAEVMMAHVDSRGESMHFDEAMEKRREAHVLEPEVVVHFKRIIASDVTSGLKSYLMDKADVDVLAMVYRQHSILESIWKEDRTHQMAFDTHIPLLVLRAGDN